MKLADEDAFELAAGVDAETAGGEEFLVVALGAEPGVADVEGTDAFLQQKVGVGSHKVDVGFAGRMVALHYFSDGEAVALKHVDYLVAYFKTTLADGRAENYLYVLD